MTRPVRVCTNEHPLNQRVKAISAFVKVTKIGLSFSNQSLVFHATGPLRKRSNPLTEAHCFQSSPIQRLESTHGGDIMQRIGYSLSTPCVARADVFYCVLSRLLAELLATYTRVR